MEVALVTVGDELLAGDTVNTNANWLATQVTERGGTVVRILTIPDDRALIAETVREWAADFDAVVVTGGLGGTPDDVTMDAVADAFGVELVVDEAIRDRLYERGRDFAAENPEFVETHDIDFEEVAAAAVPAGARPLSTEVSWATGCVAENVYVLPGVPREMKAMFDLVAAEFAGDVVSETLYTPTPEGAMGAVLAGVRERFDVTVGSYPNASAEPNRLKVTGTDPEAVAAATEWLREQVETVPAPDAER
jgi:molybdenum cofactor synthesis domain-containing protein